LSGFHLSHSLFPRPQSFSPSGVSGISWKQVQQQQQPESFRFWQRNPIEFFFFFFFCNRFARMRF
jgi:hypothetical protein